MTLANPQLNRLAAIDVILGSGSQTPNTDIADAILVTSDSGISLDQLAQNAQDDVVSPSLGKRKVIIGKKGGTATINGNLTSFGTKAAGSRQPAIAPLLKMCGMEERTNITELVLVATPTNVMINTEIEDTTQAKQGIVRAINGPRIFVEYTAGTFAIGDELQTVDGALVVGEVNTVFTDDATLYVPNSDSTQVGSIHYYLDGQREALSDCAANFELSADNSAFGKFAITALGKYDGDNWEAASLPTTNYLDNIDPSILISSQMRITFDGTEFVPVNKSVNFNFGSTPVLRDDSVDSTGIAGGFVSSRSDASGSMSIENEVEDNFNYIQKMLDSDLGQFDWRMGDGEQGGTIYFHQEINISNAARGDVDGISTIDLELNVVDPDLNDGDSFILFT